MKQREQQIKSPVKSLPKDLRNPPYNQINAMKQSLVKRDQQNIKSPETTYSQQQAKRSQMPSLEKIIASPKYFNIKITKNQHPESTYRPQSNSTHMKKLLQQQQHAAKKQQHQSHLVAPQQIDMILSENEQLKKEINMLKNLINHVVPQDILQKPIENITDIISDVSFLSGSGLDSKTVAKNRFDIHRKVPSESSYYAVEAHNNGQRKKSTAPVQKVVCQETSRGDTTYTIDMLDEFENTTHESNQIKRIQEDINNATNFPAPFQNATNLRHFDTLAYQNSYRQQYQPSYLERPLKQTFSAIDQDLRTHSHYSHTTQVKSIVEATQQHRGNELLFRHDGNQLSPNFQSLIELPKHQQKFSCDNNETGQQLLNSYLTYSAYGHSFHSEENPLSSAQKQLILNTCRQFEMLPEDITQREPVYHVEPHNILQKKTISYPQPIDNSSQNAFSSLSYTQDISCKDPFQDEDQLLDKELLNQQHSPRNPIQSQFDQQFSPKSLDGDNDCDPQYISLNDSKSDQQYLSQECQDDLVIQQSNLNEQHQDLNSLDQDQNDQSYCSIVQAEQNDFTNDMNQYRAEMEGGNQRYAQDRFEDLKCDSAEVVESGPELNYSNPSDSGKEVMIQSPHTINNFQGPFNKASEYFSSEIEEPAVDHTQECLKTHESERNQQSFIFPMEDVILATHRHYEETPAQTQNDFRQTDKKELQRSNNANPTVFYTAEESLDQSFTERNPDQIELVTKRSSIEDIKQSPLENMIVHREQVEKQQVTLSAMYHHYCNDSNVTFVELIDKRIQQTKTLTRNMTPEYFLSPNHKREQDTLINTKKPKSNQRKQSFIQDDIDVCATVRNSQKGIKRQGSQDVLKWSFQEEKEKNLVDLNKYLIRRNQESKASLNYQEDYFQNECIPRKSLSPTREIRSRQEDEEEPVSLQNTESEKCEYERLHIIKLQIVLETSQNISSRPVSRQREQNSIQNQNDYEFKGQEEENQNSISEGMKLGVSREEESKTSESSFQCGQRLETANWNGGIVPYQNVPELKTLNQSPSRGRFAKLADSIRNIRNKHQDISHFELQKPFLKLSELEKQEAEAEVQVQFSERTEEPQITPEENKNHCFDPESSVETPRPSESLIVPETQMCVKPVPLPEYPLHQELNQEGFITDRSIRRRDDFAEESTRNNSQRRSSNKRSIRDKLQMAHKVLSQYQSQDQIHTDTPLQLPKKGELKSHRLNVPSIHTQSVQLNINSSPMKQDSTLKSARIPMRDNQRNMMTPVGNNKQNQTQQNQACSQQQFSLYSSQQNLQSNHPLCINQPSPGPLNQTLSQSSEDQIVICAQTCTQSVNQLEIIEEEDRTQRGSILDAILTPNPEEEPQPTQQISFRVRRDSVILSQETTTVFHEEPKSLPKLFLGQTITKDQETKDLFDMIFKEIKRSNIIQEEPSQDEIESNESFKRDVPPVIKDSIKINSEDSSFSSIKNIEVIGCQVTVSNFTSKKCSTSKPTSLSQTINSSQKRISAPIQKKSPTREGSLGGSPSNSKSPQKRLSVEAKFKTLEPSKSVNSQAESSSPSKNNLRDMRTMSSSRQKKELFMSISHKTSIEKQTIVLDQTLESARKSLNMPLQKSTQRPPINSHRVQNHETIYTTNGPSPTKTQETLKQRSIERQTQLEKSLQRSMQRKQKMQHLKDRRDLISKAKMDKIEKEKEKFQKKYSKVETLKAELYLTNDNDSNAPSSKKQLATLVDQITSPTNCDDKRKSEILSIKKSQRQSFDPASKEATPSKQPFIYKKAPGLFNNSIKETQLQQVFQKRRQDQKNANNISSSTIDPSGSTLPCKSKADGSLNASRAKQELALMPSSGRNSKIQVPKSSRPLQSAMQHNRESKMNDSMNSSLNNSQIRNKLGITISTHQRRNLRQFINTQQSDSSRKDSEPVISSFNHVETQRSNGKSSTTTFGGTAQFGGILKDLLELSPAHLGNGSSSLAQPFDQQRNPEESGRTPSQEPQRQFTFSGTYDRQRDSDLIKKLAEDHKKRVSLRGRFLK